MLGAIEIVAEPGTNRRFGGREGLAGPILRDACLSRGLIVRAVRDSIVLSPPLVMTETKIDTMTAIFRDALDASIDPLLAI